jgi:hypothetical protein
MAPIQHLLTKQKLTPIFCVAAMVLYYEVHKTETHSRKLTGEGIAAVRKKLPQAFRSPI